LAKDQKQVLKCFRDRCVCSIHHTVVALHRYGENLYRAVDLDADAFAFMIWPTPAANPIRISLILPVYNVAEYLPECLQSVIDQSFAVSIWSKFGVS
jgi:cellulose synthase/poly-beta-1,6-N-acetylglucosamine synthase-like glycosyltransferase